MKTITVNASKQYDVLIGGGLLPQLGEILSQKHAVSKVAILSDSNVFPVYGKAVTSSLLNSGFDVIEYVFPAGESSKNVNTYISILDFLARNQMTRSDIIVALGGGVTGDMAGFAAATYLRGISYVQIPTSLLAMVDSSVGGKTAIDLSVGKNLVGAFYQPSLVLCDIDALHSLPREVFLEGCAEVIKYAILYDEALFTHLSTYGIEYDREYVISRCVELKKDVVAQDEFDVGARQKLNLGHTFGHSIEAISDFTISHGNAVAIGMVMAAKAGCILRICNEEIKERITNLISQFDLPITTEYSAAALYCAALSDKKRFGAHINLIIPKSIGECIVHRVPVTELESIFKAGL